MPPSAGGLILAARAVSGSRCRIRVTRVRWGTPEFEFTRFRSDYGGRFRGLSGEAHSGAKWLSSLGDRGVYRISYPQALLLHLGGLAWRPRWGQHFRQSTYRTTRVVSIAHKLHHAAARLSTSELRPDWAPPRRTMERSLTILGSPPLCAAASLHIRATSSVPLKRAMAILATIQCSLQARNRLCHTRA